MHFLHNWKFPQSDSELSCPRIHTVLLFPLCKIKTNNFWQNSPESISCILLSRKEAFCMGHADLMLCLFSLHTDFTKTIPASWTILAGFFRLWDNLTVWTTFSIISCEPSFPPCPCSSGERSECNAWPGVERSLKQLNQNTDFILQLRLIQSNSYRKTPPTTESKIRKNIKFSNLKIFPLDLKYQNEFFSEACFSEKDSYSGKC